jgi:hypothetical protein
VVPALFGAMAYQYFRKMPGLAMIPLALMTVLFIFVPSLSGSTSILVVPAGALSIGVSYLSFRRKNREEGQKQ